ncbi:MAG: GNAT family N-acetyltransferase [Lachnospiraceae bacterium]|nr:GNAT family N-acetyltransferase [Lachnospiraceae bacterium]
MIVWQDKAKNEKIDALTRLVPKKQFDILTLDCLCREYDGTFSHAEIEAGIVPDRHFRSFFLYYEGKRLAGELYIFPTDKNKAEITAIVDPHRRQNGIFTKLLEAAEEELEKYSMTDYVFVAEPGCAATDAVREHLGLETVRSELVMELQEQTVQEGEREPGASRENNGDKVDFSDTDDGFMASLIMNKLPDRAGVAHVCISGGSAFIYGLEIEEKLRSRGLGRKLLNELIKECSRRVPGCKIMLQVGSDNTAAVALYEKNGFTVSSRLDYLAKKKPENG